MGKEKCPTMGPKTFIDITRGKHILAVLFNEIILLVV